MRLKSLYIQGFKSFAKKTKIEFNDKITCIVGPNGSGKSNIADAIMWVLGESSAKNLRGDKMEDVIFSGTDKKRPLSLAEVSIVFDNSDRTLDIDYDTVSVTRRMYRSNETEFLINDTKCRLKDIKELFMDTGIGKDGYSLIGQGKIESILNDKPEQRRAVFDEAAGISKYKMRKLQSENKLKKTEDNIIRLNDIISQMKDREESLRVESEKAQKYKELANDLKLYELIDNRNKISSNRKNLEKVEADKNKIEDEIKKLESILEEDKKNRKSVEDNLENNYSLIEKKQLEFYELDSEIQKDRSKLDLIINRNQDLEESNRTNKESIDRIISSNERLTNEKIGLENSILDKNNKKQDLLEELKNIESILDKKIEEERAQEEINKIENEKKIENHKQKSFIESRLSLSESLIKDRQERLENIEKSLKILYKNNDEILASKNKHSDGISEFNKEKIVVRGKISEISSSIENKRQLLLNENKNYENLKTELSSKNAKFLALKNISDNYEGYNKSVKFFMNAVTKEGLFRNNLLGPVADNIKVDKKYEKAISIALGYAQQNIIIRDDSYAEEMVDYLNKKNFGRITFLPINALKIRKANINLSSYGVDGVLGFANQFLEYDPEIEKVIDFLLARIIICRDFSSAKRISTLLNKTYRVVSLKGDSFNIGGSITAGDSSRSNSSLLLRKIELDQIENAIRSLTNEEKEINKRLNSLKEDFDKSENLLKSYQVKENDILSRIQKAEGLLSNLEDTKASNDQYIDDYLKQKNDLIADIENNKLENEKYKTKLKEIDDLIIDDKNILNESKIQDLKTIIEKRKNEKASLDIKIVEISSEIKSLENEIKNKNNIINTNKEELIRLENKIKNDQALINENLSIKDELNKKIIDSSSNKDFIYKELEDLKNKLNDLKVKAENFTVSIEEKRDSLVDYEKELLKTQAKTDRYRTNINSSIDFIKERYNIDIDSYKFNDEFDKLSNIKGNISLLNKEIKNLGQVNILAIEEYTKLKEEYEFNINQKEDLLLSRKEILNVISELEDEMQKSFKSTFNEVAKNFNEIFVELFNGGQAKINIVGEDLLESGIEINVQPPGKKLQSLSLLSGGERSLTAVALLFAFLKVRPAPFCILDEIDAALDDNNVVRYANYINNISDIQFIIITHRKLSMEIANVLYGVTMEEKGVSKLISVKLKK